MTPSVPPVAADLDPAVNLPAAQSALPLDVGTAGGEAAPDSFQALLRKDLAGTEGTEPSPTGAPAPLAQAPAEPVPTAGTAIMSGGGVITGEQPRTGNAPLQDLPPAGQTLPPSAPGIAGQPRATPTDAGSAQGASSPATGPAPGQAPGVPAVTSAPVATGGPARPAAPSDAAARTVDAKPVAPATAPATSLDPDGTDAGVPDGGFAARPVAGSAAGPANAASGATDTDTRPTSQRPTTETAPTPSATTNAGAPAPAAAAITSGTEAGGRAATAVLAASTVVTESTGRIRQDGQARTAAVASASSPVTTAGGTSSVDGMVDGVDEAALATRFHASAAGAADTEPSSRVEPMIRATGGDSAPSTSSGTALVQGAPPTVRGADAMVAPTGTSPAPAAGAPPGGTGLAPGWEAGVSRQMAWMAKSGVQSAEIALNPPHLGPLEVRLAVSQGEASVTFLSGQESVRDALEQSMPRLRELLGETGMRLGDAEVGDRRAGTGDGSNGEPGIASREADEDPVQGEAELTGIDHLAGSTGVDLYA